MIGYYDHMIRIMKYEQQKVHNEKKEEEEEQKDNNLYNQFNKLFKLLSINSDSDCNLDYGTASLADTSFDMRDAMYTNLVTEALQSQESWNDLKIDANDNDE